MEEALQQLNDRQREAAVKIDRHVRVVAGAGSGKTRMLMARIQYLIQEIGIYPSRIMAITFTNKAANEMKERLEKILPDEADRVRISTIHRLCVRILREDAQSLGYPKSFSILDADDQKRIISRFMKERGMDQTKVKPAALIHVISSWKTKGVSEARARRSAENSHDPAVQAAGELYGLYEQEKRELRAMDFDDLLVEADRLLKQDEQVRTKWQNRLDYIHVDEFQDIDPLQYDIIRQLVRKDAMLCVVGDPDQTIYTWRGAAMNILLLFDHDFTPCHTVILDQNYRSTPTILKASNAVIAHNRNRIKKDLFSTRSEDEAIELYEGIDGETEAAFIALKMKLLHKKRNMPWTEMAVLYRTNYLSRYLENAMRHYGIPYRIYGGVRFYERAEVKDMLSYLHLLCRPEESDPHERALDLYLERIINVPRRGIGAVTLEKLHAEAAQKGQSLLETLENPESLKGATKKKVQNLHALIMEMRQEKESRPLPGLVDLVLEKTGYREMLESAKEEERLENVQEITADLVTRLKEEPGLTLEDYLQEVALLTDTDTDRQDGVSLMTVHAAKGTEYDAVFVASFNENIFPSHRAMEENREKGTEEERRLLYVAMTRARKVLTISWNRTMDYVTGIPRSASRFLAEIPDEYTFTQNTRRNETGKREKRSLLQDNVLSSRKNGRAVRFRAGMLVEHDVFGEGVVVQAQDDRIQVAFSEPHRIQVIRSDYKGLTVKSRKASA